MVMSLHKVQHLEDYKLLSGYVATFLGEFDAAQSAFMESSQPLAALEVYLLFSFSFLSFSFLSYSSRSSSTFLSSLSFISLHLPPSPSLSLSPPPQ